MAIQAEVWGDNNRDELIVVYLDGMTADEVVHLFAQIQLQPHH